MSRKSKQTDAALENLAVNVRRLVSAFTEGLKLVNNRLEVLEQRHDGLAADVEEVREVTAPGLGSQGTDTRVTLEDVFIAELDADEEAAAQDNRPYNLAEARNLYVSGQDAFEVAARLIDAASDEDIEPTSIILSVQYEPAGADGEPAYFAGNVAVSI